MKWPKKKPKEEKGDEKDKSERKQTDGSTLDGTLRELGAKHLLVNTSSRVLRFRLLAKTRFVDKNEESIRDSLLQPGDLIAITVTVDDPETAQRVTLLRSGSAEEKAAAARPVDAASVRAPTAEDFGTSSGPMRLPGSASEPASPEPESAPARPHTPRNESAPPRAPGEPSPLPPELQLLADARDAALAYGQDLPNFVAEQSTTRAHSPADPPDWRILDVVTAEVSYVNGREQFANVRVNGQPASRPVERSGAWSTGDFATTLDEIFDPQCEAQFVKQRDGRAANRPAYVYTYSVAKANSTWTLVTPSGARIKAGHKGQIWIDQESRRVLRIEQFATDLPAGSGIARTENRVEYGFVKLEAGTYLLPAESEYVGCLSNGQCTRNTTNYRNYRKFGADSKITY